MTTITEKIIVHSEDGESEYPSTLDIRMDGSKPTCPVTFWMDETPVFSMASDEVAFFCEALMRMDCSK